MKRKVLCVLELVLFCLVACTILSGKIEKEMTTLVLVQKKLSSKTTGNLIAMDSRAIFIDENGNHLYEVREGTGWETGLRTYAVPNFGLDVNASKVSLYGVRDYYFVRSASRQPLECGFAEEVKEFEVGEDGCILYYYDGLPPVRDFPENSELTGQSDNAFLLDMKEVSFPFFSHMVKTQTIVTDMADRIFSLKEAELFLKELPKAGIVFAVLGFGVVIWVCNCYYVAKNCKMKYVYWLNTGILVMILLILQWILNTIDFPASMLPARNIFEISYYVEEYRLIFDTLKEMGQTSASIFDAAKLVSTQGVLIGVAFVVIAVLSIAGERRLVKRMEN